MRADVCLSFSRHLSRRGPPRALRDEHRRRQREGGPPGKGPPPGYRGPGNPRDGFPPGTTRDVETIPSVTSFVARGEGSRNAPTPRRADSFAAAVTSDCLTYSSHPHCAGAKRGLKVPLLPRGMKMNFRTQKGVMSFPFHPSVYAGEPSRGTTHDIIRIPSQTQEAFCRGSSGSAATPEPSGAGDRRAHLSSPLISLAWYF